jgi:hypothetical protein
VAGFTAPTLNDGIALRRILPGTGNRDAAARGEQGNDSAAG